MPEPLLDVREVDAFYGDFQALFGVSLRVEPGQVVAVIGANGAGKSTLLKTIAGLMAPRRGDIVFAGEATAGQPAFAMLRRGIAMVPSENASSVPGRTQTATVASSAAAKPRVPVSKSRVVRLSPTLAGRDLTFFRL